MVRIQRTALKSFKSFLEAHTESKDARKQSQQCKPLRRGMTDTVSPFVSGQYKLMQQQQAPKPGLYLSHVSTQTSPKPEFCNVQLQSELEIESEPRFFPRWTSNNMQTCVLQLIANVSHRHRCLASTVHRFCIPHNRLVPRVSYWEVMLVVQLLSPLSNKVFGIT